MWDHPRSRGVYTTGVRAGVMVFGSSPLARGLLDQIARQVRVARIIPARAGFTPPEGGWHHLPGDHPRSRGVYPQRSRSSQPSRGSSPLARGLHAEGGGVRPRRRIIPARAGFTPPPGCSSPPGADHPRSRGVYGAPKASKCPPGGSSPLARGLPGTAGSGKSVGGIIPARAGFTLADPWNPNEPVLYQTPAAFTADPGPAPPGRESSAVVRGAARR